MLNVRVKLRNRHKLIQQQLPGCAVFGPFGLLTPFMIVVSRYQHLRFLKC